MKTHFSASFKPDYGTYRRFAEFQLFKGKNPLIKKLTFYGLGLATSFFLIFLGIVERSIRQMILGGIVLLCVALFTYLTKQIPKKYFYKIKKNKKLLDVVQSFDFTPEGIIVEMKKDGTDNREEIEYSELFAVYEVRDAFYLYVDRMSAYIIPKASIKGATAEQAAAFFAEQVDKRKYITVK